MNFSLGKVNYCIKSLTKVGLIKLQNFSNSDKKLGYLYVLTPKGIKEKTILTKRFLKIKQLEYEKLYNYLHGNKFNSNIIDRNEKEIDLKEIIDVIFNGKKLSLQLQPYFLFWQ